MKSASITNHIKTWFVFQNNQVLLIKNADDYQLLPIHLINEWLPHFIRKHLITRPGEPEVYTAELPMNFSLPDAVESLPLRKVFTLLHTDYFRSLVKAYSIVQWDNNHRFCGRCAHETQQNGNSFERICPICRLNVYPRISPSMIVLIQKNDHILMARNHHFPPGAYGLLAGFIEPGETIEEAVHREVKEEVSITIKNLRYFGSQPWPFPDSLMIGFMAEYDSGDLIIDHVEIEHADWYRYDNLPGRPSSSISIAAQMIDAFIAKQTKK